VSNAALAARAQALGLPRALRVLRYDCALWSRAETVRALEPRQVGRRAGLKLRLRLPHDSGPER
jgi:hypothetical protein